MLPGPLTPRGVPRPSTGRDRFDAQVRRLADALIAEAERRLGSARTTALALVEVAVEETPLLDDEWAADTVPLGSMVRAGRDEPARLVVFRKPIELRAEDADALTALLLTVLVEQLADLLGVEPAQIDPRYES